MQIFPPGYILHLSKYFTQHFLYKTIESQNMLTVHLHMILHAQTYFDLAIAHFLLDIILQNIVQICIYKSANVF